MTASVQYWRLPEEEADMIGYMKSSGRIMALPLRRVSNVDDLTWRPLDEALREPDLAFLITPEEFVPAMQVHHNEQGFAADVVRTPALHYSRGQLVTPNQLSSTSLSATWADHPADFVRWGRKVMEWVRRTVPDWYKYKHHRITAKAEAARIDGMEMSF
jgi:hypothetical protein